MGKMFEFPKIYGFKPFFTIQKNVETRDVQLNQWCRLIVDYCQSKDIHYLSLSENTLSMDLFKNTAIDRSLNMDSLKIVCDYLVQKGHGKWNNAQKTELLVLWKTPSEWAEIIYKWAHSIGRINSIETVYNLREGDDTVGEAFHGLPQETIVEALKHLESVDKCRLMENANDVGVKFLNPLT
eukprot:GDKK01055192.1.p1 GENE.GDKK01055192.1~~GDKK01055192.1.p1  ORF type:complete len:182 (+),score=28.97 GDKK01055192.1:1-546(+)